MLAAGPVHDRLASCEDVAGCSDRPLAHLVQLENRNSGSLTTCDLVSQRKQFLAAQAAGILAVDFRTWTPRCCGASMP